MVEGYKSPVALFVFNRPDTTKRVLGQLKHYDFPELLIYSDGARDSNLLEAESVQSVRQLCYQMLPGRPVTVICQPRNLGLLGHFRFGLKDFFSRYPQGIILEDDCLPSEAFFEFCNFGLNRYADDDRIAMVQGSSFLPRFARAWGDYYLGKDFKVWGWASWSNRLDGFDPALDTWAGKTRVDQIADLISQGSSQSEAERERKILLKGLRLETWDLQLTSFFRRRGCLSISPVPNLVVNIGFGDKATHTVWGEFTVPRVFGDIYDPYVEDTSVLPKVGAALENAFRVWLAMTEMLVRPATFLKDVIGLLRSRLGRPPKQ